MTGELKQILSVSRRTDIPAFYMPWFMDRVAQGSVDVVNPFNFQVRQVDITPRRIHSLVFWSKNFGPFLAEGYGEKLAAMGYHLFFNHTINSHSAVLEPMVPDLGQRLDQLRQLCRRFGAAAVQWRFDPICHFRLPGGAIEDNLADFTAIAAVAGECGIMTCISSFMDHYRKIERRTRRKLAFIDPELGQKVAIVMKMEAILSSLGIQLNLCCEKAVLEALPEAATIAPAACIPAATIMALYGGKLSLRKDAGQRRSSGCACTTSIDVGTYSRHPCHHNCLFCYANPSCDQR